MQEKRKVTKAEKVKREPSRSCSRLNGSQPEFKGLADDHAESCDGVGAAPCKDRHV